ncbi:MAG: hypothetical protein D6759_03390 [Chloroflexi bacterium]|nr:MAG: hypothetical protein D6759_03390 [Chloroflexota bacterium]
MATKINAQTTPQGLLIPRAALQGWDEVEVIREEGQIIIRPVPPTRKREAIRDLVIQTLREDGLLVEMKGESLWPPVTPEERAELARKLSVGQPLSEIALEEREEGW